MSYTSELTLFLQELHKKNPKLFLEQKQARQIWWDKLQKQEKQAPKAVAKPYPYFLYFFK